MVRALTGIWPGADHNASTEAQRDLRAVDARISELSERKLAIEDRLSRTEIRSPVSGYVNELFVHTVGGVITPAAKIATIVPQKAELKFEIRVSPADIDPGKGRPTRPGSSHGLCLAEDARHRNRCRMPLIAPRPPR
jgi:multidrug efflux pump subunit AcrA (membrane-fusion protein)